MNPRGPHSNAAFLGGATQGHLSDFKKFFYWLFSINLVITIMEAFNLHHSPSPAIVAGFTHDLLFSFVLVWAHFQLQAGRIRYALEATFWGLLMANIFGILQPVSYVAVGLVSIVCSIIIAPFYSGRSLTWRLGVAWASTVLCLVAGAFVNEKTDMSSAAFFTYRAVLLSMATGVALLMIAKSRTRLDEAAVEREKAEHRFLQLQRLDAIGKLAGGVAHDFNNLLAIIQLSTEAARETKDAQESKHFLESVLGATQRGMALTRQLTAFSRAQPMRAKSIDLNHVMAETAKLMDRLIGEDIKVHQAYSARPAIVFADPDQLGQVLMNLAVNARDAMPQGGDLTISTSHISIGTEAESADTGIPAGDYVQLLVTDDGEGMNDETVASIFEPFFTTKAQGKGTGLGLAVVYGIVRSAHGFIRVSSRLGQGTSFKIFLPRRDEGLSATEASLPKSKKSGAAEKILLVEDEGELRQIVATMLRQHGYQVFDAVDADSAKKTMALLGQDIDLLFCDIVMPGQRGDDLARELRMAKPGLKVLFSSGYAAQGPRNKDPLESAVFLAKPYDLERMLDTVRKALDSV